MMTIATPKVPQLNAQLSSVMGHPVDVEIVWAHILHAGLDMHSRLAVCTTLTSYDSKWVLQQLLAAIQTVLDKADAMIPEHEAAQAGHDKNILRTSVTRIRISMQPGIAAKPTMQLEGVDQSQDSDGSGNAPCA
jgi:hypothetical protein